MPALMTAVDLARELQVSLRTVRRMDLEGHIPQPVHVGRAVRWRRDELAAWLRAGCPRRDRWTWLPAHN